MASTLAPLHALTASVPSQKSSLQWSKDEDAAFSVAKLALCNAVKLVHPDPSPGALWALTTDASSIAVGAVLSSGGVTGSPVAFFSKKLTPAQTKYSPLTGSCWMSSSPCSTSGTSSRGARLPFGQTTNPSEAPSAVLLRSPRDKQGICPSSLNFLQTFAMWRVPPMSSPMS